MARVRISGMKELMNQLAELEKVGERVKDDIVRECAEDVKEHLVSVAPVDASNKGHHGNEFIQVKQLRDGYSNGSFYVDIGLSDNKGEKNWEIWRGLWFQEYKTDEPNFGWMTKAFKEVKAPVQRKMRKKLRDRIEEIKRMRG